jgi:hypothetical protein
MNGKRFSICCVALFAFYLPPAQARAADDALAACAQSHPLTAIARLADLPAPVRDALAKQGAMADKNAPFNATDVIVLDPSHKTPTLPGRRFVRAGQWRDLVFVWYEQGGIALFHRAAAFRLKPDGTAETVTFAGGRDPCALQAAPH